MFHSIIYVTTQSTPEKRLSDFQESGIHSFNTNSTDTITLQTETSIGVEQIRELKHFLSTKPLVEEFKTALILQAELLTHEAQNALLKSLEEPPTSSKIILITHNTNLLLPTIISRCHIIKSVGSPTTPDHSLATEILHTLKTSNLGDKIALSDTYKDRTSAQKLTSNLIITIRQQLLQSPDKKHLYNLTLTLYTHKILGQNANTKLALDNLFLNLKT